MIKYHDNIHGQQYGADHSLTDNWQPEPIYGVEEYISVYFRIDAKGAGMYGSFAHAEQREAFYREAREILKRFDVPEGTGHITEKLPGMEHLYIHPQNISGVVAKNKVKAIAEALDACKTVSCRWVDVYRDISTMDNAAFCKALDGKTEEIEADLLKAFQTKRKNLFIVPSVLSGPVVRLSEKYTIPRRSCESGRDEVCIQQIGIVFDRLVAAGKIVSAETKHGMGYRTAKKDEMNSAVKTA